MAEQAPRDMELLRGYGGIAFIELRPSVNLDVIRAAQQHLSEALGLNPRGFKGNDVVARFSFEQGIGDDEHLTATGQHLSGWLLDIHGIEVTIINQGGITITDFGSNEANRI